MIKAEWNYKEDQPELVEKLTRNIKRNGQVVNIIVRDMGDDTFEVVNGNHRLEAFLAAGMEEAHVFNVGRISDVEAKRLAIETNETRFDTNEELLNGLLRDIAEDFDTFDMASTMDFDVAELDAILDPMPVVDVKPDKARKDKRRRAVCPNCQQVFDMRAVK